MNDERKVSVVRPDAPRDVVSQQGPKVSVAPEVKYTFAMCDRKTLTPGEERSLLKIAALRGTVGRQAGRIRQLEALLRDLLDQTAPGSSASQMIERGLSEWPEP